jgi:cobalt-zinc-cadmium resistance protein CzcA
MLKHIIHFSVHNKVLVGLLTITICVLGIWSFTQLPIDAIPDNTNNQVQVLTVCPTLATQEVEQFVTSPIENTLKAIPGVVELRSISRFGLSVITVVFNDDIDIYWARQQINERLKAAEDLIPAGFGTPELAPISTGLGEIVHYRVEAMPGFEHKYSASDLRTVQDWVVKKQLAGTPGVIEINSFGGHLKQYEVAVTPERLRALGVSLLEVLQALEMANENTGGAYIEKESNAYFIRAEGLAHSIDDLGKIVVKNTGNTSIKIADVGTVQFGSALRYGAVSHNGTGEIVLGIVMMLKGENAAEVVGRVKAKLEEIKKSLPEGITVSTFLDREKLVNRTISTVEKNLLEGALIVIFILTMLVGNFRAGLIIATVIPLSMFFAFWMMHLFGVSANLMSLGALDFGLIVDGAVIIVEATLHFLHHKAFKWRDQSGEPILRLSQASMDESVTSAASGIIRSSVFGVIIILIVYLPILSLTGVEGRMFKPMAQTVSFALIGALLLSLTFVPAASALFLNKQITTQPTFADRLIQQLQRWYAPLLVKAFHWKKTIIGATVALLFITGGLFLKMGGEFIPTLDEGDIMMHGFLRPGTSLSQTLESHRLVQKIILENFPDEVEQVISKIGSAEIPTDPMAIETADNIILLKDKKGWKKTTSKEELVAMIEEKVHEVPGMAFEFTQPIKMRFDEMMTGVRSDIAVKIFGENLDSLARVAHRAETILQKVAGLEDIKVEQTEGLPQIVIQYDYSKIARYGLHIRDINAIVRTAFAGSVAGTVFEDEKRFDLVVRLDQRYRKELDDVKRLPVTTHEGVLIPLEEIATVEYKPGAAQISRDNAQRRIVIGANVRGRDVESAILEVQALIDTQLKLPIGYSVAYGGQFENLQAAKERLSVAVPVALLLIFVLLYFAFNSFKESALIFTAIPMSAIGGVFALLLRDMPFSISAGVGFIALFGVAVLNGIVLLSYFNDLKNQGVEDVYERIKMGALVRLRPVLMTAAVASLGFLPMAISTGAGAEVQRPLATVVIGGLITSTLLTLLVLPLLYALVFDRPKKPSFKAIITVLILGLSSTLQLNAQALTEQQALYQILSTHPAVKAAELNTQQQQLLVGGARVFEPANIFHNVTADPDLGLFGTTSLGLSQSFPSRKGTLANKQFYTTKTEEAKIEQRLTRLTLIKQVREIYQHLSYLESKSMLYQQLDSVFQNLESIAATRYTSGESSKLDQLAMQNKSAMLNLSMKAIQHELDYDQTALGQLLGLQRPVKAIAAPFDRQPFSLADTALLQQSASVKTGAAAIAIASAIQDVEKAKLSPTTSAGIYGQVLGNGALYPGWQLGLNIPILKKSQQKSVEAAALNQKMAEANYQEVLIQQRTRLAHLLHEQEKYELLLNYYNQKGKTLASELLRTATINYQSGEMEYSELVQHLEQALQIEFENLENLYKLNLTIIELQTLTAN